MKASTHAQTRELLLSEKFGTLDAGEQAALEQHLLDCAACRDEAAFHRDLQAALRREALPPASNRQIEASLAAIQAQTRRKQVVKRAATTLRTAAGFGLILLVAVLALNLAQNNRLEPGSGQNAQVPEDRRAATATPTATQITTLSAPATAIITYTVKTGDTLFSIANAFHVTPETVLWSNFDVLSGNPDVLSPGQELVIPPVDGVYYLWQPGDNLKAVAARFGVDPQTILEYPGNQVDPNSTSAENFSPDPGSGVIIPGGKRTFEGWDPPAISRDSPAEASYDGPGACGEVNKGATGSGVFAWPTKSRSLSPDRFSSSYPGIDIAGQVEDPVYAADSGVVVFAGWSESGLGNLVVIDHGSGWQSAYGHLDEVTVACGESTGQGTPVGALGQAGNASAAVLHFELLYEGEKVDPLAYLRQQ